MRFRHVAIAKNFVTQFGQSIDVAWGDDNRFRVVIKSENTAERPFERAKGTVQAEYELSASVQDFLDGLSSGDAFPNPNLPANAIDIVHHLGGYRVVHSFTRAPWEFFPDEVSAKLSDIHTELATALRDVFDLFRWRNGALLSERDAFHESIELHWSKDGKEWVQLEPGLRVESGPDESLLLPENVLEFVRRASKKRLEAPLHHELLREAFDNRKLNPRSALVLAIASAEIAVKHCINELAPEAAFLIEKQNTRPLEDLLRHYLHTLPDADRFGGIVPKLPNRHAITIKKGVEYRNQVSHRPNEIRSLTPKLTLAWLSELFLAISDLLWQIDIYLGVDWAARYIPIAVWQEMQPETA